MKNKFAAIVIMLVFIFITSMTLWSNAKSEELKNNNSYESDYIEIKCTPDKEVAKPGETVNYTINIKNNYHNFKNIFDTLSNVNITDCSSRLLFSNNEHSINIGEIKNDETAAIKASYTVPQNAEDGFQFQTSLKAEAEYKSYHEYNKWVYGNVYNASIPCTVIVAFNPKLSVYETAKPVDGSKKCYEISLSAEGTKPIDTGYDIVIAIDSSKSMGSNNNKPISDIENKIDKFLGCALREGSNNQVSVVNFSDKANIMPLNNGAFSNDKAEIRSSVYCIQSGGKTNIQDAFLKADDAFKMGRPFAKKAIVLFSDGLPTVSNNKDNHNKSNVEAEAINAAREAQMTADVYTVGYFENISDDDNKKTSARLMKDCAGNGNFFDFSNLKNIGDVYTKIINAPVYCAKDCVVESVISKDVLENFNMTDNSNLNSSPVFCASQGDVHYDPGNRKIVWNIGTIGNKDKSKAVLKYKIYAKPNYNCRSGPIHVYDSTKATYTDYLNQHCGDSFDISKVDVTLPIAVRFDIAETSTNYLDSADLGSFLHVSGGYNNYTYKWHINGGSWTSDSKNPNVIPEKLCKADKDGCYVFSVDVSDECGDKGHAELTLRKGKIIIVNKFIDKNGNELPGNKDFEAAVEGHDGAYSWNTFINPKGMNTFDNIKLGTYEISEPYVPYGYKFVSMKVNGAESSNPIGVVTLTKESPIQIVTITNQVAGTSWFTDENEMDDGIETTENF